MDIVGAAVAAAAAADERMGSEHDLKLLDESEITAAKNISSSPMVFATKILYKIFALDELIGHNVSGKTFNKYIKNKKALDEKRINYIRWLVETYFLSDSSANNNNNTNNSSSTIMRCSADTWKSCRTAINKSIRNNEIKYLNGTQHQPHQQQQQQCSPSDETTAHHATTTTSTSTSKRTSTSSSSAAAKRTKPAKTISTSPTAISSLVMQPTMTLFQMTDDDTIAPPPPPPPPPSTSLTTHHQFQPVMLDDIKMDMEHHEQSSVTPTTPTAVSV